MDDLIVQGGIVAGQQQDIAIQQGRIRAVAPGLRAAAREQLEVTGKLVLPGFVESHIHPDKAFVADRAPGLQAGGPTPQVLLAELKKAFTVDDVYQRARRALRYAVRHGCTAMRAHVEVDAYVGLRGVEALQRLQAECAGVLDFHADSSDDPALLTCTYIAEQTIARGMQGRVVLGHLCTLDMLAAEQRAQVIDLLQWANIHAISLPA